MAEESKGLDWRWVATGALAIIGIVVPATGSMLLGQHVEIEVQRDKAQDDRLDALNRRADVQDAQLGAMNQALTKLPVMDVKLSLIQSSLEKLEKAVADQQARDMERRKP